MNEHQISFDIRVLAACQIDPNKGTEEFTDILHGLCSWIYLGDDEENEVEGEDDEGKKDQEDDEDAE